jgi:hypothetical protein
MTAAILVLPLLGALVYVAARPATWEVPSHWHRAG